MKTKEFHRNGSSTIIIMFLCQLVCFPGRHMVTGPILCWFIFLMAAFMQVLQPHIQRSYPLKTTEMSFLFKSSSGSTADKGLSVEEQQEKVRVDTCPWISSENY
jgi:hypothetical protein